MARVSLPASNIKARRRRRRVLYVFWVFIALLVFILGLAGLSNAPFLRVEKIVLAGVQTSSTEKLTQIVQAELDGSYWYIFAKNNIFMYPRMAITRSILASTAVVKSVEIYAKDLHTIEVSVAERSPKALWCIPPDLPAVVPCFYMDENGVIYGQAPEFSAPVYITYQGIVAEENGHKQFLSAEVFRSLSALIDALGQTQPNNHIRRVVIDDNDDALVYFQEDFLLMFALNEAGGDVFERYKLAFIAEPFKNKKLSDFEYLDLRFGDKLYYKVKTSI